MKQNFMYLVGEAICFYDSLFTRYGEETCVGITGLAKKLNTDYSTAADVRRYLISQQIICKTEVKANVFNPEDLSLGYDGNRPHQPKVPYYGKGTSWRS
jgi:hypothetical protein